MSTDHLLAGASVEPVTKVLDGPQPGVNEVSGLPAWARDESGELTEVDDADERRAEAIAEALLAGPVPPADPDASPKGPPPGPPPAPADQAGPPAPSDDGEPLPQGVRRWAEARTGGDLADVRVHRSPTARRRAERLDARAFTVARHIVLGDRVGEPYAGTGLRTLAHEIGHVVAPPASGRIGRDPNPGLRQWDRFFPENDPEDLLTAVPGMLAAFADTVWTPEVRNKVWSNDAQTKNAPENALHPIAALVITENVVVVADPSGAVANVSPRDEKKFSTGQVNGALLVDYSTGVVFEVGQGTYTDDTSGMVLKISPSQKAGVKKGAKPGESVLAFQLHGYQTPAAVIARLKARIGKKTTGADGGGGQGDVADWTRNQVDELKKHLATKAGDPKGLDPHGQGKGDSGEGKGAGHGKGDGIGDGDKPGVAGSGPTKDPNTAPKPPVGTTGDKPLQGPVQLVPWNSKDGTPGVSIGQDRAWTWLKLIEGEDPTTTAKRLDDALQKLQDSRDPANSARVANGATTTGIVTDPKQTTGAAKPPAEAVQQAKSTPGAASPGQRIPGARGGANATAYPSRMLLTGKDPDPKVPAMTVSGATNDFMMDLDYAALSMGMQDEVWNRLQLISYYWEIIDVTKLTKDKADQTKANATKGDTQMSQEDADRHLTDKVGEGKRETGGSGFTSTVHRDLNAISEDEANDLRMMSDENWPWEARAEYLAVIGISNVVRTLGSIIGAFVDLIGEPLNGKKIGFSDEGDYLVRCVATPQVSDEARADPAHHTIRASSVAVIPIRVQAIHTRAQNAANREQQDLNSDQAALDKAIKEGASQSRIAVLRDQLKNAQDASHRGGFATYQAQVVQVRASLEVAKALRDHLAQGVPDEQWSDAEVQLKLHLLETKVLLSDHVKQLEEGLTALSDDNHETWALGESNKFQTMHGLSEVRPRVVLASEETGQVTELTCMLGQTSEPGAAVTKWNLVDITSASTRKEHTGTSRLPGTAGQQDAIRDAFRSFAENNGYGRGTIAIRLPAEITTYIGDQITYPTEMRSAPGKDGRALQRLKDIAKVAAIAGLFLTGGAAVVVGAVGGIAGAIVAVDSLVNRAQTGHLWDVGTIFDALGVIAGVAAVAGVGTYLARQTVEEMAAAGQVPKWLNGLERTEKVLHLHAQFGMVQQIVSIPIELVMEWQATENLPEAQKNSRRLRALLHAAESGLMTVAMLGGGLHGDGKKPDEGGKDSSDEANAAADRARPSSKPPTTATGTSDTEPPPGAAGQDTPPAPPAPKKSVAELQDEARARAQQMQANADRAAVKAARGEENVDPDEALKKRLATPAPNPHVDAVPVKPEHAAARQEAVELLAKRFGTDRAPTTQPDPTPPQPGTYGPRLRAARDAVATYDRAVANAGGREVGLYFDPRTGEFQVEVGTPHEVNPPSPDWQAVVHLHPNPENVLTYRMPAPQDIAMSLKAAQQTGPHTEFVQSLLPDGTSGLTKVTVTPGNPPRILVELPPSGGQPGQRIQAASVDEYAAAYNAETRYVDPDSEAGTWLRKNVDDYLAGRESGGQTGGGAAASPQKRAELRIDGLRKKVAAARKASDDPAAQALADEIDQRLTRLRGEAATRDVNPDLDNLEKNVRADDEATHGPDDRPPPVETPRDTTPVPDEDAAPVTVDRKKTLDRINRLKAKVKQHEQDLDQTSLNAEDKEAMRKVYAKDLADLEALKNASPDRDVQGELDDFDANLKSATKAATPVDPAEVTASAASIRKKAGAERDKAVAEATKARTTATDARTAAGEAAKAEADELARPTATEPQELQTQRTRRADLAVGREKAERAATRAERSAAKAESKRDQVSARSDDLEAIADRMDAIAARRRSGEEASGRADYESLRRDAKTIGRQDGEVVVDLNAGTMRADVQAWLKNRASALLKTDLGPVLLARVLEFVATADTLTLKQSPRSSGDGSTPTKTMQAACKKNLEGGRYDDLAGYRAAFNEAMSRGQAAGKDWPVDSRLVSWQVDHVGELWLGGADDESNFLAVPEDVHKAKSDLFTDFRRTFRAGRIADDQTDYRAIGGAIQP